MATDVGRELGHLEAHLDVALGTQVVDLVGLDRVEVAHERGGIGQVGVVEMEPGAGGMGVRVEVLDAPGAEGAGAAHQAVDLVALGEEQLREVRAVLAGDAGDEGLLRGHRPSSAAGMVRSMICRSSQRDQRSMYSRSSATQRSNSGSRRERTCQRPVMPGFMESRRRCHRS